MSEVNVLRVMKDFQTRSIQEDLDKTNKELEKLKKPNPENKLDISHEVILMDPWYNYYLGQKHAFERALKVILESY